MNTYSHLKDMFSSVLKGNTKFSLGGLVCVPNRNAQFPRLSKPSSHEVEEKKVAQTDGTNLEGIKRRL
jgi:hypothetical protein